MAKSTKDLNRLFGELNKAQNKYNPKHIQLPPVDLSKVRLSAPQQAIFESEETINLFLAGQGAGKTFAMAIISAPLIQNYPWKKGLIGANTYSQLSGVTLFRIREEWKRYFGWKEYNDYTKEGHYTVGVQPPDTFNTEGHNFETYRNIISFCNGAVIHYHSLDNYKPIDGLEIGWALLDETKDTKPEAITEVILGRLRQKENPEGKARIPSSELGGKSSDSELGVRSSEFGFRGLDSEVRSSDSEKSSELGVRIPGSDSEKSKLYIFTSPSKSAFLSDFFQLSDFETAIQEKIYERSDFFRARTAPGKFVVISSAYHNSENLPSGWIEGRKSILPKHLHDMLIYGNPFAKSGGEFYKGFDRARHVGKAGYDASLPLHITFDFNVNPYITLCVWQIAGKAARQIDEVCLSNPRNNTMALCREFKKRYQGHSAGLFVYGDPSGKHSDTRSEKGYNDFKIIKNELESMHPTMRVAVKAPAVVVRGNFINLIFEQELYDISILIDERCKNTILDYNMLKEAADGTKHKEKAQENGVSFEKYGHTSDANDYFLCEAFKNEFSRYLRGGKESNGRMWLGKFIRNQDR